jgi:hypothetical protein
VDICRARLNWRVGQRGVETAGVSTYKRADDKRGGRGRLPPSTVIAR